MFDNVLLSAYWTLAINGIELDDTKRAFVKSVTLEKPCDGSTTLSIELQDPEFVFIDDNIFIEEATVHYTEQLVNDTKVEVFDGYISAIDISFPEDGTPVLSIYCLDQSHVMNRKEKSRSWDNTTRAAVVQRIAKEYGFKCVVQSGYSFTTEDTITQSNQTDIAFCESLADDEREPFMCKLIGDTLYYVKKGILATPKVHLYYKEYPFTVRSFSPKINKETQTTEVTVSDISSDTKVTETSVSTKDNTSRDVQGSPVSTKSSQSSGSQSTKNMKYDPVTKTWKEV